MCDKKLTITYLNDCNIIMYNAMLTMTIFSCNYPEHQGTTYITILVSYVDLLSMEQIYDLCKNDWHSF